jgi:hypothetical protein
MNGMSRAIDDQIREAYRRMATEAQYRPAAPSDGFGNITVPLKSLNLEQEAELYAQRWWKEEDSWTFHVGCAHFPMRTVMIFCLEAARLCCGSDESRPYVKRLIALAAKELAAKKPSPHENIDPD